MKLRSLHIQNIRSYIDETVRFPTGKVLLSGDIGSGKTTILLGIEFALFGLLRGKTNGKTLLRHGKEEGSVTLTLTVNNQDITIHRSLKKTKRSIKQHNTWLKIDGEKQEYTATELKAKVIDILGYPQSMVSGSKNMVYRYSVFTPQEKMKQILSASKEERLQKIRKIFRIDKYQKLKDNANTYRKQLRTRIRALKQVDSKLEEVKQSLEEKQEQKEELQAQQEKIEKQRDSLSQDLKEIKEKEEDTQKIEKEYRKKQRQKDKTEQELNLLKKQKKKAQRNIKNKKKTLSKENKPPEKPSTPREKIEETQQKLEEIHTKNTTKISTLKTKIEQHQKQLAKTQRKQEKITSLETCPVCKQNVDEEHKHHIEKLHSEQKEELQEEIQSLQEKLKKSEEKKQKIQERKKKVASLLKKVTLYEKKKATYKEKQKQKKELEKEVETLQKEQEELTQKIKEKEEALKEQKATLENLKPEIEKIKTIQKQKEELQEDIKQKEIKLAKLSQQHTNTKQKIGSLQDKKEELNLEKEKKNTYTLRKNWLKEHFLNLTSLVEKHVFLSLHRAFNDTFKHYFKELIEDDSIEAKVDHDFTPILSQNGYETTIDNLSGGEKTSVALAYRLALNKTINQKMQDVKTRKILLLDEPTDGFSSEQLDRFRDILDSLNTEQIILVSHEPKMESVTEKILRVEKNNNSSQIIETQ